MSDKTLTKQEKASLDSVDPLTLTAEPVDVTPNEAAEVTPGPLDVGWHDFVLSHFDKETELMKGLPRVNGLRRVAQILIGPIIKSVPKTQQSPYMNAEGVMQPAVVEWEIIIAGKDGINRVYGDVADVYVDNCPVKAILVHASATAGTRAEARALRKALGLRCIAAEENVEIKEEEIIAEGKIDDNQIKFIDMLCYQTDMDVVKFINSGGQRYSNIKDVTKPTAAKMIKKLSELKSNPASIKEEWKGYDENWRQNQRGF